MARHFDTELVAAARQIERLRRAAGMTWAEILCSAPPQVVIVEVPSDDEDGGGDDDLPTLLGRLLRDHRPMEWERGFCRSLLKRRKRLTFKQRCVLDQLRDRYRASWAA